MGFFADQAAKHKYNISNLYVALCTVVSDVYYSLGPKCFEQFYILRKDGDEYVEFFSGVAVKELKESDGFVSRNFNIPVFDSGVISPVSRFVKEGVNSLTMNELFYLQNSFNGILIPNWHLIKNEDIFDVFMGDVDIDDLLEDKEDDEE